MRKFVNPMKYLSKKNTIIFILLNLVYTVAFFTTFIPDSLLVRAISAVILFLSTIGTFLFVTYIQALITRKQFEWVATKNYQSDYGNDSDEEDDGSDAYDDFDEEYDDGPYNEDEGMDEDFDEEDIEEMNKE